MTPFTQDSRVWEARRVKGLCPAGGVWEKRCLRPDHSSQKQRGEPSLKHHALPCCKSPFSTFFRIFLADYFRCSGSILVFPKLYFSHGTSVTLRVRAEVFIILLQNSNISDSDSISRYLKCAECSSFRIEPPNTHTHILFHLYHMTHSLTVVSQKAMHQLFYFISFQLCFFFSFKSIL